MWWIDNGNKQCDDAFDFFRVLSRTDADRSPDWLSLKARGREDIETCFFAYCLCGYGLACWYGEVCGHGDLSCCAKNKGEKAQSLQYETGMTVPCRILGDAIASLNPLSALCC